MTPNETHDATHDATRDASPDVPAKKAAAPPPVARGPRGVLVLDKPRGYSSHDAVRALRRVLKTREIGHAGTLDPMATGVLVVGVGEGTKLLHHLSGSDKTYLATVKLGAQTDSLDADGTVTETAAVPTLSHDVVVQAARGFLGEHLQLAPAVSAIKQGGVPLYERVRRGEQVQAPERPVIVHELEILALREDEIDLRVRCGKGFYVRALARDLALALGTLGHLSALRRTVAGAFTLNDALPAELWTQRQSQPTAATSTHSSVELLPLTAALRDVPKIIVDAQGAIDVRHGRTLAAERFTLESPSMEPLTEGCEPIAVVDAAQELLAIGRWRNERIEIVRGILPPA